MLNSIYELPLVPLKGVTVFPVAIVSVSLQDMPLNQSAGDLLQAEKEVFFATVKDTNAEEVTKDSLYAYGVVGKIKQVLRLRDGNRHILAQGLKRARLLQVQKEDAYNMAVVEELTEIEADPDDRVVRAAVRSVLGAFEQLAAENPNIQPEMFTAVLSIASPREVVDTIISALRVDYIKKQSFLEELDQKQRLLSLQTLMIEELEVVKLQKEMVAKIQAGIDQRQKEYYLREQMKIIQQELGEGEGSLAGAYRQQLAEGNYPAQVQEKIKKELAKLEAVSGYSQENAMLLTYIDWILALPWSVEEPPSINLKEAEEILARSHYGLNQVKERILEFLAVSQVVKAGNTPILCLSGPPGIGKSSVAQSIAAAMGRKFVRISFGGVKDEADIRGHRRTYIGSMPGRIINAMKQAGVSNPVILMDELDKISKDFRQDPSAALLEVFDRDQNKQFRDHYIELDYDLSQVVFICTANHLEEINPTLRDRLEILTLDSYTFEEKLAIGKEYLLPRQMKIYGLTSKSLKIKPAVWEALVVSYTKEAGVRQLNQVVETICRKTVTLFLSTGKKSFTLTEKNLASFLGHGRYRFEKVSSKAETGLVRGLAFTAAGGDTLQIEVNIMPGKGKLQLTGNMGKIMQESARAAVSYVRSRTATLHIEKDFYKDLDIHIHVPEGAVPKDGPSAGITLATSLVSALTELPVSGDIAMTGEITIRGNVLPVGGIKEKVLAAKMAGIKKVVLPNENRKDVEKIPEAVLAGMDFSYVTHMDQVLAETILKERNKA